MTLQKQLQAKLRETLKELGKSQVEFARELGVTRQEVNIYLNSSCSCDKLVMLLGKLGVGVEVVYVSSTLGAK